jgi:hypothetical protein
VQTKSNGKASAESSIYAALLGASVDRGLSYGQVDGNLVREAVERITNNGDAILFGRTLDGGALTIQVLSGGAPAKFYVTDASELMELLEGLINAVKARSH